jgi:ketosteroid isomerase-like protein
MSQRCALQFVKEKGTILLMAVLITAVPSVGAGASASSDETAAVGQALIRLEHAWVHALERHDVATLRRILADDFLDTSYKGQVRTKADQLAARAAAGIESERLSDLKVRVLGNTAIVTGLNTIQGRRRAWTARIRFTDIFVKRGGRWRAVGAQETLVSPAARQAASD